MRKEKKVGVIGLRGFPGIQGGVEHHSEELYPRMPFRFTVYRRRPYVGKGSGTSYPNIEFTDLPSTRRAGVEAIIHTFLSACCCVVRRPALVHIHNIGPGLFAPMLRLFGLKVVLTYHSPNYEHAKWSAAAKAILRLSEKAALTFSNAVIFVNRAQMLKFPGKTMAKSTYIHNGVNRPGPASPDACFVSSLGLTHGSYLLAVGRITPEKGFDYLIRALDSLETAPTLVIAGGADHSPAYLRELKKLDTRGRVIFTGNLTHAPLNELYASAGAFILPSLNEGFPMVMLEAMSHSLPVFASRLPATDIPQLDDADRFTPADVEDLRDILSTRLPQFMGTRRKYDLSSYDWDRIASLTADVYRRVARI